MTQSLPERGLLLGFEQPHPCLPVPKLPLEAKVLSTHCLFGGLRRGVD